LNDFSSPFFDVNIGISQELVLSPILSVLYLLPVFYIFEKNLKISVSVVSFVDNGLFISQNKSLHISNSNLFCSYHVISFLLGQFGLIIKHGKTEVFQNYKKFLTLLL